MKEELRILLTNKQRQLFLDEARAETNNDHALKRIIAHKRKYLSRIAVNQTGIFPEPSVFVSYSSSGSAFGKRAVEFCNRLGLVVRTGFDDEVQKKKNVLSAVKDTIDSCALFLGIWTPEYELVDRTGQKYARAAPSVWMLEEKGMAEAFNKPFRLLVEQSIHNDFWLKTTPNKLQHSFDGSNFETQLKLAIEALMRRYNERHATVALIDDDDDELD
jgi:hypothetical protein